MPRKIIYGYSIGQPLFLNGMVLATILTKLVNSLYPLVFLVPMQCDWIIWSHRKKQTNYKTVKIHSKTDTSIATYILTKSKDGVILVS